MRTSAAGKNPSGNLSHFKNPVNPSRLTLLPPPRRIRFSAGVHTGQKIRTRLTPIGRPEPDAYRLTISEEGILIEAATQSGIFYGRQTLDQIRRQSPNGLPCLRVLDWPDYAVRGFYHDVTRGKVPKLRTLLALADKCAGYKINQLQLYIEHTFAFKNHPEVWQGCDPLTADEIRALDAHCAKRHIDLVPSFSTFGHLYGFVHTKKFQHLNEIDRDISDDPFLWYERQMGCTLDCRNPASLKLVREIITEVRPLFRSRYFNICCDETVDLGEGKNRKLAARLGKGRLYVDFLKKIMGVVKENGAIPMFWGDIVGRQHPELVDEIPAEAVALDWDYSARLEYSKAGVMARSGRTFYVCPGVSGWNCWVPDYRTAHQNITRYGRRGLACGATGLLTTDWGDMGHINALGLSHPGMILGASAAWNARSPGLAQSRFECAVSRYEWGDRSGRLMPLLREASSAARATWVAFAIWQQPHSERMTAEWFDKNSGLPREVFRHPARKHAEALKKIRSLSAKIETVLARAKPLDPWVAEEIRTGLLGLRVQEEVFLVLQARTRPTRTPVPRARDVARRLRELDKRLHRQWIRRNKLQEYPRIRAVLLGAAAAL